MIASAGLAAMTLFQTTTVSGEVASHHPSPAPPPSSTEPLTASATHDMVNHGPHRVQAHQDLAPTSADGVSVLVVPRPAHAADAVWGADAMQSARELLRRENGDVRTTAVLIDRLELTSGAPGLAWDVGGWTGGDVDRLRWRSEGETASGDVEGDIELLYSRATSAFWNVHGGVRVSRRDGENQTDLTVGFSGLAPHWVRLEAAAFLSTDGDLLGRAEASYDQRLTRRLILQPSLQIETSEPHGAARSDRFRLEAGLRLRYQITRTLAPYVGIEWDRGLDDGAVDTLDADERRPRALIGLRALF